MVIKAEKQGDGAFRLEDDKELMHEFTYSGALSFCRRRYSRDLESIDIVVSGIPYDNAVTNRQARALDPEPSEQPHHNWQSCLTFPTDSNHLGICQSLIMEIAKLIHINRQVCLIQ